MWSPPPFNVVCDVLDFFSCSCPTLKGPLERLPDFGSICLFYKTVKLIMARLGRSHRAQRIDGRSITSEGRARASWCPTRVGTISCGLRSLAHFAKCCRSCGASHSAFPQGVTQGLCLACVFTRRTRSILDITERVVAQLPRNYPPEALLSIVFLHITCHGFLGSCCLKKKK